MRATPLDAGITLSGFLYVADLLGQCDRNVSATQMLYEYKAMVGCSATSKLGGAAHCADTNE